MIGKWEGDQVRQMFNIKSEDKGSNCFIGHVPDPTVCSCMLLSLSRSSDREQTAARIKGDA